MSLIGKRRRSPDFDQLPDDELTILLQDFDDVVESLNERIRCPICFGLLRSAVLLSGCLHTYCSECIRRSLSFRSSCPSCRQSCSSSNIKPLPLLDSWVEPFKKLKKKWETLSSILSFAVGEKSKSDRRFSSPSSPQQVQDLLDCRGCGIAIEPPFYESHKNHCPSLFTGQEVDIPCGESQTNQSSQNQRLPELCYSIMKDKQLRNLLSQFHLNNRGSRGELIKRHKEFLILYNSRCDACPSDQKVDQKEIAAIVNSSSIAVPSSQQKPPSQAKSNSSQQKLVSFFSSNSSNTNSVATRNSLPIKPAAAAAAHHASFTSPPFCWKELIHDVRRRLQRSERVASVREKPGPVEEVSCTDSGVPTAPNDQEQRVIERLEGWRCIYSEKFQRPFYYNTITCIGQFFHPDLVCDDMIMMNQSKSE